MALAEIALNKYEVGDVVVLKSGGPLMTVTDVKTDYIVTTWFNPEEEIKEATFWHATVEPK